jgi:tetratricopeptide (TPR) repeat protein
MSLFDRQGIPESLLAGRYQDPVNAPSDFEGDLHLLINFSSVAIDVNGEQLKMHRLVQFSTRKWLELRGELESWKTKYLAIMDEFFPSGEFETWKVCETLFPHVHATLAYRPADDDTKINWAMLLHRASWYADEVGYYDVTTELSRAALEVLEPILGADHHSTMVVANNLGLFLKRRGKVEEAEGIFRRAVEQRERVFGPEHSRTMTSLINLGDLLRILKRHEEADEMLHRVLRVREKVLGAEHPDTLGAAHNIGVLEGQGRHEAASKLFQRAHETPSHAVLLRRARENCCPNNG